MFFYDPVYLIASLIMIPGILIASWAQMKISHAYHKYSMVQSKQKLTGEQVARIILSKNGLAHIAVQHVNGELSDHYDPSQKVVRLSDNVFSSTSLAAVAVAAHECGHAIQDSVAYKPMRWRSAVAPVASASTQISWIILFAGVILGLYDFAMFGAILFGAVVVFQLVTLPVEVNASARALDILQTENILDTDEIPGAKSVLSAAAMTYVAALVTAILSMVRLVIMALLYRRNRW